MASSIDELLEAMKQNPVGVRFADACKVADHFFGEPTQKKSSHRVWKMPWPGNPRVNMQNEKGSAKAYQVRQRLEAVERRMTQLNALAARNVEGRPDERKDDAESREKKKKRKALKK